MDYRHLLLLVGLLVLAGWLLISIDEEPTQSSNWVLHADNPYVVGGYGDNFAYDGKGVRPLVGSLALSADTTSKTGDINVSLQTTQASGPLHVSSDATLEGEIKLVSRIDASDTVQESISIYGDTGNCGPELPCTFAYLVGQSTFDLYLNGDLYHANLCGEWAYAQAMRHADGSIRQRGLMYSPLLRDKTGFCDPLRSEFLLILHSEDSDPNNTLPYALVLHLVFSQVDVQRRPK